MAESKTKAIEGLTVKSTPLPPMRALDLIPELADLFGPASDAQNDMAMAAAVARGLRGRLRTFLPQILAGTSVLTANGPVSLATPEGIDLALDGHMGAIVPIVLFAVEVSFRDFFDGAVRAVQGLRAPTP